MLASSCVQRCDLKTVLGGSLWLRRSENAQAGVLGRGRRLDPRFLGPKGVPRRPGGTPPRFAPVRPLQGLSRRKSLLDTVSHGSELSHR